MKFRERLLPYYQAIPKLLLFQFVSSICLWLITTGVSLLSNLLLGLSGKAAVSSGDFAFLFTKWQGYVLIVLILLTVICYVAVELNALIIYCGKLLSGEKASVLRCIKEGFVSMKRYQNPRGLLIILYAVVISPVVGLCFSVSLTESFYIPRFIMSVIEANPLYMIGYIILQAVLSLIFFIYCFILHGVLLDGMTMKGAGVASRKMVVKHWKRFIAEILLFMVLTALTVFLLYIILFGIPLLIVNIVLLPETVSLFFNIFFTQIGVVVVRVTTLLSLSFWIIKLTTLNRRFRSEGEWHYHRREKSRHPFMIIAVVLILVLCIVLSAFETYFYDEFFPSEVKADIIAHRAGGSEAPENTVKGIETAYALGAKGCEIDIQRTADGYYVVNHDTTFERVAGVNKKPSQMTLDQVRELRVEGEPVPTLEDMLDASRDKVTLFVELKGETADNQMADDAVRIIKEKGMEEQAVLISLKYNVLEYIEEKYPEMLTGYLAFISFGQIENTPFDYLALEEEIATDATIDSIHQKGKKILVWTVNEEDQINDFLTGEADGIITDAVKLAGEAEKKLESRKPVQIIVEKTMKGL